MAMHLDVSIGSIFWLVESGKQLYRWWRRSLGRNWPLAVGAIEHAARTDLSEPSVHLRYSYSIAGEWYAGEGTVAFENTQGALEFVLRAKGKPIRVSFNPNDPEESSITKEQLQAAKEGVFSQSGEPAFPTELALPLPLLALASILMVAAIAGVMLSLFLHVAALTGRLLFTTDMLLSLAGAGFAVFFVTMILEVWGYMSFEERVQQRPPMLLRGPMFFFWATSGIYFFAANFISAVRSPAFDRQFLCSFGEFMLWGILMTLYSLVTARRFHETGGIPAFGAQTS